MKMDSLVAEKGWQVPKRTSRPIGRDAAVTLREHATVGKTELETVKKNHYNLSVEYTRLSLRRHIESFHSWSTSLIRE